MSGWSSVSLSPDGGPTEPGRAAVQSEIGCRSSRRRPSPDAVPTVILCSDHYTVIKIGPGSLYQHSGFITMDRSTSMAVFDLGSFAAAAKELRAAAAKELRLSDDGR
jgi:hypothetical protein